VCLAGRQCVWNLTVRTAGRTTLGFPSWLHAQACKEFAPVIRTLIVPCIPCSSDIVRCKHAWVHAVLAAASGFARGCLAGHACSQALCCAPSIPLGVVCHWTVNNALFIKRYSCKQAVGHLLLTNPAVAVFFFVGHCFPRHCDNVMAAKVRNTLMRNGPALVL